MWSYVLKYETNSNLLNETYSFYAAPCNGLQGAVAQYAANQDQEQPGEPFIFIISALGSFTCVTQHTGPTALRPSEGRSNNG